MLQGKLNEIHNASSVDDGSYLQASFGLPVAMHLRLSAGKFRHRPLERLLTVSLAVVRISVRL